MENRKDYNEVNENKYYSNFGLKKNEEGGFDVEYGDKLAYAYKRACENRDFEINKFWSRAAYFWGFIALIFGAYLSIVNNNAEKEISSKQFFYEAALICLGLIFSFAWNYVIIGSKHWQENWEKHIDMLENFLTGPLYKTVFYKKPFYSVSKVNKLLSELIIVIWFTFLINFIWNYANALKEIEFDWMILIVFGVFLFFFFYLKYGYPRKEFGDNNEGKFIFRGKPLEPHTETKLPDATPSSGD